MAAGWAGHLPGVRFRGAERLLPHLAGAVVESIERAAGAATFRTRSGSGSVRRPGCGRPSRRVHGRCVRRLADASLGGARRALRHQGERRRTHASDGVAGADGEDLVQADQGEDAHQVEGNGMQGDVGA